MWDYCWHSMFMSFLRKSFDRMKDIISPLTSLRDLFLLNSDGRNWNIFYRKRTTFCTFLWGPPSGTFPVGFGYHRKPFVSTGTVEMCKGIAFERPIICSSARGLTSLTATQATNICFSSFAVWTPCFVRNVFLTTVPGCSWPRYFGFVASAFVKD